MNYYYYYVIVKNVHTAFHPATKVEASLPVNLLLRAAVHIMEVTADEELLTLDHRYMFNPKFTETEYYWNSSTEEFQQTPP